MSTNIPIPMSKQEINDTPPLVSLFAILHKGNLFELFNNINDAQEYCRIIGRGEVLEVHIPPCISNIPPRVQ
jgi:hypothetical protein